MMIENKLSKLDYEKLFGFVTKIQNIKVNFRRSILNDISNLFGYNYLTFFLADRRGNLINPITTNINPILTQKYMSYYHRKDIFCIGNEAKELFRKNIISIKDIMSYKQFENTEYYRDFLCLDNLYYEIAIPLKVENELIGGIGAFRPRELGDFTAKDIIILEKLSIVISNALNNHIRLNRVSQEQEIFKDIASKSPMGVVVLNSRYSIVYCNSIAEEFCLDILNDKTCLNPIKYVIDKLLMECELKKDYSYMYCDMDKYNFRISSSIISNEFKHLESVSYIYIAKKKSDKYEVFERNILKYNLTNREIDIINLLSKGLSNKEIAQSLFISCHTVKTHIENIFKKTEVDNRTSLIYKINNNV